MMRFDVKFDQHGNMLMPRPVADQVRGKKLIMVLEEGEIRIMSNVRFRNLAEA